MLALIPAALAATIDLKPDTGTAGEKIGELSVGNIAQWLVTMALVVAGVVFFFMLVIGGIRWMTSGGDKANTESARNQITAALIGLIIVFSAWAVAALINTAFGIDILNLTIPEISTTI